jgi:5-formyltetrahydrofolate cyclo-ligase
MADERPLHRQVRDRLREIVLAQPIGERTAIPPEPDLEEMMAVSRGTVRKAVDSLVAEGLLIREQGRGTFVEPAAQVRRIVAERLAGVAKPDSRLDDDFQSFIPDFDGSDRCAETIAALPAYQQARTLFVSRDNNLQPLRQRALRDAKRLVVPSHALRTGVRVLEGVPEGLERFASMLDGVDEFGETVSLSDLRTVGPVALAVTGAVAVTPHGAMFGARHDYFRVEMVVLAATGALAEDALTVGVVHDCQVIDRAAEANLAAHVLELVVTPTTVYHCQTTGRARRFVGGVDTLDRSTIDTIPGLRALLCGTANAPPAMLRRASTSAARTNDATAEW